VAAAFFVDSCALVKRCVQEAGTAWVRNLTHRRTGHEVFLARITVVEVTSAIARRRGGRAISSAQASYLLSRFRKHLAGRYTILEVTPLLLADATTLANRHELRAYGAVQLAVGLDLNRRNQDAGFGTVTLVSADRNLNAAAAAEGLTVEDPNTHR
jgi:predicted nucleic acid-binding protein